MLELVTADKLQLDIFSVFGTNNGLLMAGDKNDARVMTIGWANPGRTWNIPTCIVYVWDGGCPVHCLCRLDPGLQETVRAGSVAKGSDRFPRPSLLYAGRLASHVHRSGSRSVSSESRMTAN